MEHFKLREVFKPSMADLGLYFYQLERMIEVCPCCCCSDVIYDGCTLYRNCYRNFMYIFKQWWVIICDCKVLSHTHIHTHARAHARTRSHACTHTHMHTHTHTRASMHARTRTYIPYHSDHTHLYCYHKMVVTWPFLWHYVVKIILLSLL